MRPQTCVMGWQASELESTLSEFNQLLSKHLDYRNEGFDGDCGEGLIWKGTSRGPTPQQPGRVRVGRRGADSGLGEALRQAGVSCRSDETPPATPFHTLFSGWSLR